MTDFLTELRGELLDAHRTHRRRSRRRRSATAAAALLWRPAPLLAGAALAACLVAVVVAVRSLPAPGPATPHVAAVVRVGGIPVDGVVHAGSLWVADLSGSQIVRLDPDGGRVAARIRLDGQPVAIAAGDEGGLWVRIADPAGPKTTVARIDPATNRVAARTRMGFGTTLAVSAGTVWVPLVELPPEGLALLDASDGRRIRRSGLRFIYGLATGGGKVWALATDGSVVELDAAGRVRHRWPGLAPWASDVENGNAIASDGDDGAWVVSAGLAGTSTLVHLRDGRVARRIPVATNTEPVVAAALDGVWIADGDERRGRYRLLLLDPGTGAVTARVDIGAHRPAALVPAAGAVYVVGRDGAVVRVAP